MTTQTEGRHAGEFILSEGDGEYSRENVTLASGQVVVAGQVLGKITSGGKYTEVDQGASDGSQTAVAVSINAVDATSADTTIAVIARHAEVNLACLDWGSQSATEITTGVTELAAVGIICR
jgi:hypothetical protein